MIVSNKTFELTYHGRHARRADSRLRRKSILEATLRLIVKEGIRGVHHRTVASEAAVPLAATTYYFKDLNELIGDACTYFVERNLTRICRLREECFTAIPTAGDRHQQLIQQLRGFILAYVRAHAGKRSNLLIDLAFRSEALHNEQLGPTVRLANQLTEKLIRDSFDLLQLPDSRGAAQILHGTILNLESQILSGTIEANSPSLDSTVRLLIHGLLQAARADGDCG